MTKFIEKYPVMVLLLSCLAVFFCNLGELYVNIMEARNFISAREMLHNGNWLLTTLNGMPRYEKPPLPTWITALSGAIFGLKSLFGLRIPAALAATLLVFVMYKFGKKLHGQQNTSLYTSLILATSFYIIFSGRNGQWDIFTHSFMGASIYFFYLLFQKAENIWRNALFAGLLAGASFLSKGPVSLYALFLPFIIAYGIVYRFENFRKRLGPFLLYLIVSIVSGLWWFVYVRLADPVAFIAIASEETANWSGYNIRPFYYYWSFFTQSGVWTIPAFVALLYPYLKHRVSDKKAYLFSFLWTISAVILLSIIPEKKSRYLLPVLIPLAMNTAFYIEYLVRSFPKIKNRAEKFPVYFNYGLIALIGISFPVAGYLFFGKELQGLWFAFISASIFLFAIGILMLKSLIQKNIHRAFFLTIAFIMCIVVFGFPLENTFSNNNPDFNNINLLAQEAAEEGIPVYSYGEIAPESVWEFGQAAPRIDAPHSPFTPSEKKFGVLVPPAAEDEFKRIFAAEYDLRLRATYDLNYTAGKTEKSYKLRLLSQYYILTEK
ncbi:ArnT family glycosyltransferase [Sinomicrobium sp.]